MTLHMSSDTVFTIPYHGAMGPMLGFLTSVVTSTSAVALAAAIAADSTREYVYPRLGGTDIGVRPSATVVMPPTHNAYAPYSFRKEGDNSVNMNQRFDTIYIYTNVVEPRIIGDRTGLFLR